MSMSANNFTGGISRAIGNLTMLRRLYLAENDLRGELPGEIGNLQNLEVLSISDSGLVGSIPSGIFNISTLFYINLGSNQLSGSLPSSLGISLPYLEEINLQGNQLTGNIPTGLFNISTLRSIALAINQFSGTLPESMGNSLPNLQGLNLAKNRFTGNIPSSISNCSMLNELELAQNSFSGVIPSTLGNLRFLQWVNLRRNNLTADISSFLNSLTNCRYLGTLLLSYNPINGVLPISIGNLSSSMEGLFLSNCNINGSIPSAIGNLSNLVKLELDGNELTGSIPGSIGRLRKLQGLQLQENELKGSIPVELCSLERLTEFYAGGNRLSGSLPGCLNELVMLRTLSLGSNRLTYNIPSAVWSLQNILHLNLSSNSLTGSLPIGIGNLKVTLEIDLSRNQLSGDIPISMGDLTDLQYLSLADNTLQGPIPDSFGALTSLEFLDISNNTLSGEIPDSLEELLFLNFLDVSFNRLEGEVPTGGPFANFSAQSFIGNNKLCGASQLQLPPCETRNRQKKTTLKILLTYILPIVASAVIIMALVLVLIRRWKGEGRPKNDEETLPVEEWRRISYHELSRATNGFSDNNLLGKGSFGSVYKGILPDGKEVAIKVFHLQLDGAHKSFEAECEVLRNIRHRNLVKVISSCANDDFKALVLEYMPNGSVDKWLHDGNYFLDVLQRLNMVIDVALALEYLHHGYSTPIVHCDMKPSNVLLDESMVAHLSDFGISKLLSKEMSMTQTQTLATIGYMAPEYGREGKVSRKGDIYSYGVLLIEIFTGKRPTDEMFSEEMSLKRWVSDMLDSSVMEVADANLLTKEDENFEAKEQCVKSILSLALECTREPPKDRIDVKEASTRLLKFRDALLANTRSADRTIV